MNRSRLILLSVITLLASICIGVVLAQPSNGTNPVTRILTVLPNIPANDTKPGISTDITTSSPYIPYPYPYYGSNYLVQIITQLLTTAKDGTYTGLSISTQSGVTTIKADEITVTSDSFSLHLVGFTGVIDTGKNVITLTASLIDFKEGQTTFYGKDVSFSSPTYPAVYSQGVVGGSGVDIPPTPTGK